jgi:proline racemase
MATLYAKGKLQVGQPFRHENLLDISYTGRLVKETRFGNFAAVVPAVSGTAWI